MSMVYAPWVEKAARQIACDESTTANPIQWQDVAETISQAWEQFAGGCPRAETPPVVPPNLLEERIAALELRMDELTGPRPGDGNIACREKVCTFHTHYQRNYDPARCGEKLDHAAYHAAEGCCEAVQQQIMAWINAHPNQTVPEHLQKRADYWEARSAF